MPVKPLIYLLAALTFTGCRFDTAAEMIGCDYTPRTLPNVFAGSTHAIQNLAEIPAGDWYLDKPLYVSNTVRGAGAGITRLWSAEHLDTSGVNVVGIDAELSNLTIVGNIATSKSGHCLRGSNTTNLHVHDVEIVDCSEYGIGLQKGTEINPLFERVTITNTRRDGFDIKDANGFNRGLVIDTMMVHCAGQDFTTQQAGVDVRGRNSMLYNVTVTGVSGNGRGIRFREGALDSFVEGYYVECVDSAYGVGVELRAEGSRAEYGETLGCR